MEQAQSIQQQQQQQQSSSVVATQTQAAPDNTVSFYCHVCRVYCTSAANLEGHCRGSTHRNNLATTINGNALACLSAGEKRAKEWQQESIRYNRVFRRANHHKKTTATTTTTKTTTTATPQDPLQKQAARDQAYSLARAQYFVPGVDEFGCLIEGGNNHNVTTATTTATAAAAATTNDAISSTDSADNDFARIDAMAQVQQHNFDDAVVEVALCNYECYHGLTRGTATFHQVSATSAGIMGWADCVLDASSAATKTTEAASEQQQTPLCNDRVKSDDIETRQLQMALLESIGISMSAFANPYHNCRDDDYDEKEEEEEGEKSSSNEDEYEYEYEDEDGDDDEEEEHQDDDSHDEATSACADCLSEQESWSLVSDTSSSYAMPDAAEVAEMSALLGETYYLAS